MRLGRTLLLVVLNCCATAPRARSEAPNPADGATVVARTSQGDVTEKDLDAAIAARPKLSRQLYEVRRDALEDLILRRLVEAAAAKQKLTVDAYLRQEIDGHAVAPTDAEVHAFFDHDVLPTGAYRYDDVRDQIAEHLLAERRKQATLALVERLRAQAQVEVLLVAPRIPVPQTGPSRGPANAAVTIVEFSDFQCPYCRQQAVTLNRVLQEYPREVRLVFLDFPLSAHPDARNAAQAAACAGEQGRFWAMHDLLFKHQEALGPEDLHRYAGEAGVDGAKFDACVSSGRKVPAIEGSLRAGEQVGVDGTPALFVNGRPLAGAVSYVELKQVIDQEITSATSNTTPRKTRSP
jgi:protein-disulfide isomerase